MAEYQKNQRVSGDWVKATNLQSGTRAKLVSAVHPVESQFTDKDGNKKNQDVGKIVFENDREPKNVSLNRATIDGLVDAFGTKSEDWVNKPLTVQTEKMIVGGKRVTALYLLPDGYALKEDEGGFMQVVREDEKTVSVDDASVDEAFDEITAPF